MLTPLRQHVSFLPWRLQNCQSWRKNLSWAKKRMVLPRSPFRRICGGIVITRRPTEFVSQLTSMFSGKSSMQVSYCSLISLSICYFIFFKATLIVTTPNLRDIGKQPIFSRILKTKNFPSSFTILWRENICLLLRSDEPWKIFSKNPKGNQLGGYKRNMKRRLFFCVSLKIYRLLKSFLFSSHCYDLPRNKTKPKKYENSHGWPSFRDEETNWEEVRCLKDGECVSTTGTHLGHNLPDGKGNRYCINLVSVAGQPEE